MSRRIWLLMLISACGLVVLSPSSLHARVSDSPELVRAQAAHVLGFLRYTQWPAERRSDELEVLVIGSRALFSAMRRRSREDVKLGHAAVRVRRADPNRNRAEDLIRRSRSAHAVFISDDSMRNPARLLKHLAGHPVLTIGDSSHFTQSGGMLQLVLVDAQLTFDVNMAVIDASRLRVSAKALKLARSLQVPP